MKDLRYHITLRLYLENKSFGPGPMKLLQGVLETGSLHKSAASLDMSYSKAWKIIQALEAEWEFPILERKTGGAKGGGSTLTPKGAELLEKYSAMLAEIETCAEASFKKYFKSQ